MSEKHYWTLCITALLFNLIKFFQKYKKDDYGHLFLELAEVSTDKIIDKSLFEQLVQTVIDDDKKETVMTEIRSLIRIIDLANNYATLNTNSSINNNDEDFQLQNIFSRIELDGKVGHSNEVYQASPFRSELIFSADKKMRDSIGNFDDLLRKYIAELKKQFIICQTPEELFRAAHLLSNKYCWCLPANAEDRIADISLFDHMSVTSAITACLYKYHNDHSNLDEASINCDGQPRFLLVAGDISGIQKYIAGGGKQSPNGLVRRLRARSFMVSAITYLASFSIIQACRLPQSCILQNSGGDFLIILPNSAYCIKQLSEIKRKIDDQLFSRFMGELNTHIAYTYIKGSDFKIFGQAIDNVKAKLSTIKHMPMESKLKTHQAWLEDKFIIHNDTQNRGMGICVGCYKEYADKIIDDEKTGPRCREETFLGSKLPTQPYFTLKEFKDEFISAGNLTLSTNVSDGIKVSIKDNSEELNLLWPIGTYVPIKDGQLLTFEDIADKSNGFLGWLKADIDNLRALFSLGLYYENDVSFDSVSRIATISRMLDTFFSQWLPEFVSQAFRNCYIVYTGGDDLLIVGPWDEIIDLAAAIHDNFGKFTAEHPAVTISAGIALSHPRLPMSRAFQMVDEALEMSKQRQLPGEKSGKDQLTIFGSTIKWKSWPAIREECQRLKEWHRSKYISSSDLYKFKHFANMFTKFELTGDVKQLSYSGLLAWEIGKKFQENKRLDPEVIKWMNSLVDIGPNATIRHLQIACDYALLSNRRRNTNDQ